ncbi:35911_t:CDS:1, partial [Gigaspora margarita]
SDDDLQYEVQRFTDLSRVTNTDKNTEKWLRHVEQYRKERNVTKKIEEIDNKEELDTYL